MENCTNSNRRQSVEYLRCDNWLNHRNNKRNTAKRGYKPMSLRSKIHQQNRMQRLPKTHRKWIQKCTRSTDDDQQHFGNYLMYLIHKNAQHQCIWWDECQYRSTIYVGHSHKNAGKCIKRMMQFMTKSSNSQSQLTR